MNRGLVVRKDKRTVIVLTSDGRFVSVRPKGQLPEVGEDYSWDASRKLWSTELTGRMVPVAVMALLLMVMVLAPTDWAQEVEAYVTLETNPGVELAINPFQRVVNVRPINEDGRAVVEQAGDQWIGQSLNGAISLFLKQAYHQGYLHDNGRLLVSTSTMEREAPHWQDRLYEQVLSEMGRYVHVSAGSVLVLHTPGEIRLAAMEKNTSTGRYALYLAMQESGQTMPLSTVAQAPIREVLEKSEDVKQWQSVSDEDWEIWMGKEQLRSELRAGLETYLAQAQEMEPLAKEVDETWWLERVQELEERLPAKEELLRSQQKDMEWIKQEVARFLKSEDVQLILAGWFAAHKQLHDPEAARKHQVTSRERMVQPEEKASSAAVSPGAPPAEQDEGQSGSHERKRVDGIHPSEVDWEELEEHLKRHWEEKWSKKWGQQQERH